MTPGAALVTGGAKRLGAAMARDLAAQGWAVAIHHHTSAQEAEALAAEIRAAGGVAATLQADLTDEAQTHPLIGRAAQALGRPLTLLVNSASIFDYDTLESATRESWDRHFESNLRAPYVLTQHFAAQAPKARMVDGEPEAQACIVNMIDQRVWKLTPAFSTYTLAKAALWAFTQTAAQGLAPHIRVNGVGPGPTLPSPRQSEEHFRAQRKGVLLERGPDPAEICAGLRFILGARSMTGQMLALDGGQHLAWRTPDVIGRTE